jgi:hypothetical protein
LNGSSSCVLAHIGPFLAQFWRMLALIGSVETVLAQYKVKTFLGARRHIFWHL